MTEVGYRLATEADRHFAEETWLASFRSSNFAGPFAPLDRARWREQVLPEIRRILGGPQVEIHVAYNPEMPADTKSDIYGWLAIQRFSRDRLIKVELHASVRAYEGARTLAAPASVPRVLFVYVKDLYRGAPWHFARELFRRAGIDPWRDAYEYVCRTEAILKHPGKDSRWDRPMIERMERAQWNPRATRWRQRHAREDEGSGEDVGGGPGR